MPHLHLSVCCEWREIWCATRHAWLRVWSEGIRRTLIHATLLTLATICVLRCESWSGLSAACTSRVSTLLSHHLCASTRNGGCLNIRCVSFSSPSVYCGGSVCSVSSLSSPQWMMWPVLVRSRKCLFKVFESCNDLAGMVCAWDVFVEEGSAIDTSLIQHSLLECTSPVFC